MRYFHISNGLRGSYLPDSSFIYACKTRGDLRTIVENEVRHLDMIGASKRNVTAFIAAAWRSKSSFATVLPLKSDHNQDYSYGLFVSNSTKADMQAQEESGNA